jgi:AraC family transcriptional activator of pobA
MPEDVPLQVIRMNNFFNPESFKPHRHAFFMLIWSTHGKGTHRINNLAYDLDPGRIFFTHEGQVHQIIRYPDDGWIILFKHQLFKQFLDRYPEQEQSGLYDYFNRKPFTHLDQPQSVPFNQVCTLLEQEAAAQPHSRILINYLSILLFQAQSAYTGTSGYLVNSQQTEQLRKLKILIEHYYKTQKTAPFYSNQLGMPARKLNDLTLQTYGKLVQNMIQDRLLSESEALLCGTNYIVVR